MNGAVLVPCGIIMELLSDEQRGVSIAEQKAAQRPVVKAKMQAKWREQLASGDCTVEGILTSCSNHGPAWRMEAAQWLAEITQVGATEAEAQAILDARKREFQVGPAPEWEWEWEDCTRTMRKACTKIFPVESYAAAWCVRFIVATQGKLFPNISVPRETRRK